LVSVNYFPTISLAPFIGCLPTRVGIFIGAFFESAPTRGGSKIFQMHAITCAMKGDVGPGASHIIDNTKQQVLFSVETPLELKRRD
jgi:hypothetical protein